MKLVYVNELGPDYKGNNTYEFIFSESEEVYGEDWDVSPASGRPFPPQLQFIHSVLKFSDSEIKFDLVQNSDYFNMYDAVDGVICLAWESEDSDYERMGYHRFVFRFGDELSSIKDKFYERDIVLSEEKILQAP